jgi:hypothetical protein
MVRNKKEGRGTILILTNEDSVDIKHSADTGDYQKQ